MYSASSGSRQPNQDARGTREIRTDAIKFMKDGKVFEVSEDDVPAEVLDRGPGRPASERQQTARL